MWKFLFPMLHKLRPPSHNADGGKGLPKILRENCLHLAVDNLSSLMYNDKLYQNG